VVEVLVLLVLQQMELLILAEVVEELVVKVVPL